MGAPAGRPAMISFCTHFLSRVRLHVYRQVTGIRAFENWVVTRQVLNPELFPYPRLHVLRKSPLRFLARLAPWRPRRLVPLGGAEIAQLEAFAAARDAALVHVYFGTEAVRLLPYLARERRPRVVSFHGADVSPSALPDEDLARLLAHVDLVLCRSRSLAEMLAQRGCPPGRIRINRTGVPVPAAVADRARDGTLRLFQAGRFVPKKGVDVSVRALAALRDAGVRAVLTLAGDGPELTSLQGLVRALALGDAVRFVPFMTFEALAREMERHDVFLQPSRTTPALDVEGIPNAMLEAMAHGLPVVGTRHSGIPEAVTDGVEGLLVDEAAPGPLAAAVARLAGDAALVARLGRAARRRVASEFSLERAIDALEAHYREAVAGPRPGARSC